MKKIYHFSLIILLMFSLSACSSGISQESYDTLSKSYSELQEQNKELNTNFDALQHELSNLQSDYDTLKSDFSTLESDYASYKEQMAPYEALDAAEAQARQIEAEKVIAEQRAAEEAAAAEAAAALAAEEAKGYETGITYSDIARKPDDFLNKKVKFTGKVIQVLEGDGYVQIRFAIDKDYDQIVFCEYDSSIVDSRILQDDIITIYGISLGIYSYQSTGAGQISIPAISIDRIDQ